ncbi:LysM peptidoglycan-binding domain-containing protein [Vibrio amylolyticus]|uniref:LysM peptidoglycan-binding domain-containing protein n=1 Tax=Vibrio amylolyticus TaxID=2847292 RepID=UPI003553C859
MTRVYHFLIMFLFSAFMMLSMSVFANQTQSLTIKEGAPKTYTVVKGDTLWDISELYLDSPWLWPKLWKNNPDINNPHLIYPGDRLTLYWVNGQPVLSLKPMVKLSPKVRVLDKHAVPTIKEGLLVPYLQSDRLINLDTLNASSKVLGASSGKQYLTSEESLFISGDERDPHWGIYRVAQEYQRDDKVIVALKRIASAKLRESEPDITRLQVINQEQEIWLNDIALPDVSIDEIELTTTFYPSPSPADSQAKILGALNGSQYSVKNQVVIINKGSEDALSQGSMYSLLQSGVSVYNHQGQFSYEDSTGKAEYQLPNTQVGSLMVIRPYRYFSLALITVSDAPIGHDALLISPDHDKSGDLSLSDANHSGS